MYLWLDLETTGLNPQVHSILECAAILTTPILNDFKRIEVVVECKEAEWSLQAAHMHMKSGLVDPTVGSCPGHAAWVREVQELDEVLGRFVGEYRNIVLAGNSVHFDRGFIRHHLPELDERLSYRHFDVSVLRNIAPIWWPDLQLPEQTKPHRAMADIEQALDLARFFKEHLKST